MKKYDIGFIGCGNMGGSLLKAVVKAVDAENIAVCSRSKATADAKAEEFGVVSTTIEDIAENCSWIFLAVKPQTYPEVCGQIKDILIKRYDAKDRFVIVSMAAGIKTTKVTELLGRDYPVIRMMPNTPSAVGMGMITYCSNDEVSKDDIITFVTHIQAAGLADSLDEKLMDAGCALAGCGPAFVYMFIDALAKGGEDCGIDREKAIAYAVQTIKGSAALLENSKEEPDVLRDRVCSPGGSTIEGVKLLQNKAFEDIVRAAVEASYKRNIELGK